MMRITQGPTPEPEGKGLKAALFLLLFCLMIFAFWLPSPARAGCGDPENGLDGWWKFDDGSGSTAVDSSGQGNNGTLQNSPTWQHGEIGGALSFNESSAQWVHVTAPSDFIGAGALTVSAWVYPTADSAYYAILRAYNAGDTNYFELMYDCCGWHGFFFFDSVPGSSVNSVHGSVPLDQWTFLTAVRNADGKTITLYINGLQAASGTLSAAGVPVGSDIRIANDSGEYFNGLIDDVRIYNRALSATEVKNLYNADYAGQMIFNGDEGVWQYCDGNNWVAVGSPLAPQNGLVGWWKFDDGSGTSAVDSSGNDNTGTLNGSPLPSWTGGYVGTGALEFSSASSQFVDVGNSSDLNFDANQPFSVAAWIYKFTGCCTYPVIIAKTNSSAPFQGYTLMFDDGSNQLYAWIQGQNYPASLGIQVHTPGGSLDPNAWQHVVMTYDGSSKAAGAKLYINGVAQTLTVDSDSLTGSILNTLGTRIGGASFPGLIDDVRVYDRVLSTTEVTDLYLATGGSATGDTTTGLVGWWKFDDGTGTTVADSSGQGDNGTLTGALLPTWTSGKIGGAIRFASNVSGTAGYVSIPNASDLSGMSALTVTFWAYVYNTTATGETLGKRNSTCSPSCASYAITLQPDPTRLRYSGEVDNASGTTNPYTSTATGSLVFNKWQFVAMTYDGSNVQMYIDGAASGGPGALTGAVFTSDSVLRISEYSPAEKIDDVRVYNRALSATDIAALYNARACANPTGWAGDFRYDADSGKNAMIFCDGQNWQPMGPMLAGAGGGGCTTPVSGNAGDLRYFGDMHAMAYCNGTHWVRMGRAPVGTTNGLVGWWKLDDGSGLTAADSSGKGDTGTLANGPTWTTGKIGGALAFNGTNQVVNMPDTATLDLTGSWTASAWVNLAALPAAGTMMQVINKTNDCAGDYNYDTFIQNTAGVYSWNTAFADVTSCSAGYYLSYAAPINTGTWYLLTGVWDNTAKYLYLYLNGVLVASQSDPTAGSPWSDGTGFPLAFGALNRNNGQGVNGTIDDVRVYDRALSAAEVWDLYLATGGT